MKLKAILISVALLLASATRSSAITAPVLPIEGTWVNLAYQDVRNKYTNNIDLDYTDAALWQTKVNELADMGMRYLIFMAVANEGKAYYPSSIMPHTYPDGATSPVDAIMQAAAERGLKVFMSTGWAKDQDDNLQDPAIRQRQLDMMTELARLYGSHPAMYGWYLPVEDCLCPMFSQHAVDAVNALTDKARSLTPGKKILISPYGIVDSAFDDPQYEKQLAQLKVDIIAYQDEIGCVREPCPLPRLRRNWWRLADIHSRLNIEMWANCETFTWEAGTNDRTSALIPAAYPRLLAQQSAASVAGAKTLISFMFPGIIENPQSRYKLGQPVQSAQAYTDYMDWKNGALKWRLLQASYTATISSEATGAPTAIDGTPTTLLTDGRTAQEQPADPNWLTISPGFHTITIALADKTPVNNVMMRLLEYRHDGIATPQKANLYGSTDGENYRLLSIKDFTPSPNNLHDAWVEPLLFDNLPADAYKYIKIAFTNTTPTLIDEIYVNAK